MIVAAFCSAVIVRLVQPAIDKLFIVHDTKMLIFIPLVMVVVYSLKGISEYIQGFLIKSVGQRILTNIQILMYKHLLFADMLFIQSQSSGRLISSFTNDIILMRTTVTHMIVGCAKHALSIVFLVIMMFSLNPLLSVFIFLAFPLAVYPIQKVGRRMRAVTGEAQEELSNFTARLDETFHSAKIIKSFCIEEMEIQKAKKNTDRILSFYNKAAKFDSLTSPIMEILTGISIACVLWYGGYAIGNGSMTAGALVAFITAFVSAYRPFKSLVSLNVTLQEGIAAANRVLNILDSRPDILDKKNAIQPILFNSTIEFKNVNVAFQSNAIALKSFNLSIKPKQTYALVGKSGSGKTTVANLLVRFFDPQNGKILINGHEIRDIQIQFLRRNISIVTQDTMLFDSTVSENIALNASSKNREDIIAAARLADAHEFIMKLPKGYDTIIGPMGSKLSGGQKQRISIARALFKDAPIVILDEATSALDPKSERVIINSITKLKTTKTIIMISHRLSSIAYADQIIVMKNGELIEQGSHDELLSLRSEYYELYNKELQEQNDVV